MGLKFSWDGVSAARKTRLQKAFVDLVPQLKKNKPLPKEVTATFIENHLKQILKSKVYHFESNENGNQFAENFSDPV